MYYWLYRILCVLCLINERKCCSFVEKPTRTLKFCMNSFQKKSAFQSVPSASLTHVSWFRCLSFFVHKKRKWFALLLRFFLSLPGLGPVFVTPCLLTELLFVAELFFLFRFTSHACIRNFGTSTARSSGRARLFLHRSAFLFVGRGSGTARTYREKTQLVKRKFLGGRRRRRRKEPTKPTLGTAQLWV